MPQYPKCQSEKVVKNGHIHKREEAVGGPDGLRPFVEEKQQWIWLAQDRHDRGEDGSIGSLSTYTAIFYVSQPHRVGKQSGQTNHQRVRRPFIHRDKPSTLV